MGIFDDLDALVNPSAPAAASPGALASAVIVETGMSTIALEPGDFPDFWESNFRGNAVGWSPDLDRVIALPRRVLDPTDARAADAWTKHLRNDKPPPGQCDCDQKWGARNPDTGELIPGSGCINTLKPIQGWGLEEAMDASGLVGSIGVGEGKTGLALLLAMAIPGVRNAVLLIQPNLKDQLVRRDIPQWSAHFKLPNIAGLPPPWVTGRPTLVIVTYSELSQPGNSDLFRRYNPDLVIADEGQNLKNPKASRTGRFLRMFKERPNAKFAVQSGTITTKSLNDYAHLVGLALKEKSPMPLAQPVVAEWASALDAGEFRAPLGALSKLCNPGESAHAGYRRRLIETRGVVATSENSLAVSLSINEREIKHIPAPVLEALSRTRETWERPDGEELVEALQHSAVLRQLASGFYYRWKFPRGETAEQIDAWLLARKLWFKEVRDKLKRGGEFMDSPFNVTKAALRWEHGYHWTNPETHLRAWFPPATKNGPLPAWKTENWKRWNEVHATVKPETEAVWLSEYLAEDAAEWARAKPGIVWYEHAVFGAAVARIAKVPHYGAGPDANRAILEEKGNRSIVASQKAHGTGKNLQKAFWRNLIANPMSDGAAWEQTLGRTHRFGQPREEVIIDVYRHTPEIQHAIDQARDRARYIEGTTGSRQKLASQATIGFT